MCWSVPAGALPTGARLYDSSGFEWYGGKYRWVELQQALTVLSAPGTDMSCLGRDEYQDPMKASSWDILNDDCVYLINSLGPMYKNRVGTY